MEEIYGFGPRSSRLFAQRWGSVEAMSDEDLARVAENTTLTWMQRVGLRYHRRFRRGMARGEVTSVVRDIRARWDAAGYGALVRVHVCGSYRRQQAQCNDIDLLVVCPPGMRLTMQDLLRPLRDDGLVPADGDLVRHPVVRYMGFCRSPVQISVYRRLDIYLASEASAPMALLSMTGSADFNRALRERAKELGARLSSKSLEWRETSSSHVLVKIQTERDIFRFLGIEYVSPRDR